MDTSLLQQTGIGRWPRWRHIPMPHPETHSVQMASDGTLTIVHEDDPNHFSVVANVPTPKRSRTITLDEKTHQVIVAAAEFEAALKPTAEQPRPRPAMKADSFSILMVGH